AGIVDAEQDLALHGERLGPAARGRVDVAQPAREARALGMDGPRPLERVGGGAEVARTLGRLGEEDEEPRLGPGLLQAFLEDAACAGGIVVVEMRLGEEGQPVRVTRHRAALDAPELVARLL